MIAVVVCLAAALGVSVIAHQRTSAVGAEETGAPVPEITAAEEDLLYRAEQVMLQKCMQRRGFRYEPGLAKPAAETPDFPYVVDDPDWARRHGFGNALQASATEARSDSPNRRYFQSLPPQRRAAALAAANGRWPRGLVARTAQGLEIHRSDEGCTSELERDLYGDLRLWFQATTVTSGLPAMRRQRVTRDAQFTQAQSRWAQCMTGKGYRHATPAALHAAFRAGDRPAPSHDEIVAAVAEATCARDTGFAAVARNLDAHHAAALRDEYRKEVSAKARLQRAALPKAREIVDDD